MTVFTLVDQHGGTWTGDSMRYNAQTKRERSAQSVMSPEKNLPAEPQSVCESDDSLPLVLTDIAKSLNIMQFEGSLQ